jgi:hypothetical protein
MRVVDAVLPVAGSALGVTVTGSTSTAVGAGVWLGAGSTAGTSAAGGFWAGGSSAGGSESG